MFESLRIGERPYGSSSQPALLQEQINFNWRRFTCTERKATKSIESTSDKLNEQNKQQKTREKHAYVQGEACTTVKGAPFTENAIDQIKIYTNV